MKLEIKNLTKDFNNEKVILENVNLCEDINTLALIGQSGCGKSTLLRMIGGLITTSKGDIILDENIAEDTEIYRKNIGFVFQNNGLFHHLSAKNNITLPLTLVHKFSEKDANDRAEELLVRFGLEKDSYKKPLALSGGQQQRISIARAVAPRPKILLLDEPTSALDPEYTNEVLNMINELKNDKVSFIIATHEMGFALNACEKVAFLSNKTILEYDNSQEIFKNPKTKELQNFLSKLLEWNI